MGWRTGHGAGKGVPRIEVMPADELPPASPMSADRIERTPDGRFARGNTAGKSRRLRPGSRGTVSLESASPEVQPYLRWGRRYATHRRAELAQLHGGNISAAVGALIESAGSQLGASRYTAMKAAASGDPALFTTASKLANDARQNELAAWELAAREAKSRAVDSKADAHARALKMFAEPPAPADSVTLDEEPQKAPKLQNPRGPER